MTRLRASIALASVALLLFGSDVAFQHADWPVARLHATAARLGTFYFAFSTNGDTTETSAGQDLTGATLIVFPVAWLDGGAGTASVADSQGNIYTCGTTSAYAGNISTKICYKENPTVSAAMTFTISGAADTLVAACPTWYSGTKLSGAFDQQSGGNAGSGTTLLTGLVTPSEDNEVLSAATGFGVTGGMVVSSIDSSFTLIAGQLAYGGAGGSYVGLACADKIQTSAGAENATWTYDNALSVYGGATRISTFKMAAAAAAGTSRLMLLGAP